MSNSKQFHVDFDDIILFHEAIFNHVLLKKIGKINKNKLNSDLFRKYIELLKDKGTPWSISEAIIHIVYLCKSKFHPNLHFVSFQNAEKSRQMSKIQFL